MKIAIVGDIHGWYVLHEKVMREHDLTLQIGDCGFDYGYLKGYDAEHHKVLGGNHDNYPKLKVMPHYLGDFGEWNGLWYVRGAWSIDRAGRTEGVDWWPDEELSPEACEAATAAYAAAKPKVMVSHDGPPKATERLVSLFPDEPLHVSRTSAMLAKMLDLHEPELWVFGHWHQHARFKVPGCETVFHVLDEAEVLEVDLP